MERIRSQGVIKCPKCGHYSLGEYAGGNRFRCGAYVCNYVPKGEEYDRLLEEYERGY